MADFKVEKNPLSYDVIQSEEMKKLFGEAVYRGNLEVVRFLSKLEVEGWEDCPFYPVQNEDWDMLALLVKQDYVIIADEEDLNIIKGGIKRREMKEEVEAILSKEVERFEHELETDLAKIKAHLSRERAMKKN